MSLQIPIYIAFRQHQVAVRSNSPEFLARVRSLFYHLLTFEPTQIVGQFDIYENNGKFFLTGTVEESEDRGTLAEILCRLKYEVVTCLVRSHPDLLWFHAGAVAHNGQGVLLPGAGGQGKSTIVTRLCAQGWKYLSEDIVALDLKSGTVLPFPQTPRVRENVGRQLPLDQVLTLNKTEVFLPARMVCFQPLPIQAVVFPSYTFQPINQLLPLPRGIAMLELLKNSMNFAEHQHALGHSCNWLKQIPTFALTFSDRDRATQLIIETCIEIHAAQTCLV